MEIKFNYIAAWKDWSRQNWSLTAQNESEARAKLHSMWFSVLKISSEWVTNISHKILDKKDEKKNSDNKNSELKQSYEFSWFKITWEEVDWNIEATNWITALKRLYDEYKFNITWLVEKNLSPAIKEHKKKWSVDKILSEAFDEWIFIEPPKEIKISSNADIWNISNEEREAVSEDVKKYIIIVKSLLKNCNWIITWVDLNNLKNQLSDLEKIQKSNNLSLIQSDLESLLKKVLSFFNDKNKEDLPEDSLKNIREISSYLWVDVKDFVSKNILPFLEKFSFLKDYLNEFKKYLESKKNTDLIQKRNNLKRYIKRFFLHLRLLISSRNKEERKKRLAALKKTFSLIGSTYKTYSLIKDNIAKNRSKYYLEFRRWNIKLYKEIRFISALVLSYYFIYFVFIDFWLRKWIFINYKLWYFTIWSNFILTLLFAAFLMNFLSLIKIKYFLKNIYFNLFFWFPLFVFMILFYYVNY